MIKEMAFIKDSKPFIEELQELRDIIFQKKKEKYDAGLPLGEVKDKLNSVQTSINKLKKEQDNKQVNKEGIQKSLDKINSDRN